MGWLVSRSVYRALPRLMFFVAAVTTSAAHAQGIGVAQAVGGVSIDARGTLLNAEVDQTNELRQLLGKSLEKVTGDLAQPTELRKISLARLEQAVAEHVAAGKSLSNEMRYLAGLQTVRYVLVYPEQQDVVLVGYAEGWRVDVRGFVVGRTTGRPVLHLDDFLVALRSARQQGRSTVISCSIDPTAEGMRRLREYATTLTNASQVSTEKIEQLLGPQDITFSGVPADSHFARVLVAADYRMKRIGMKLDPAPVSGLPSYLDLLRTGGRGLQNITPRWWMVPKYLPLLTDAEGRAWELRGGSVQTMTEDTFFDANGVKNRTEKTSPTAQLWADRMTQRYEALAIKEPIFAQLRSCIDLAVVSALIVHEGLLRKAGCSLPVLTDGAQLPHDPYVAPRTVPSQVSMFQKDSNVIISASGGVEIRPGQMIQQVERVSGFDAVLKSATPADSKNWWWN